MNVDAIAVNAAYRHRKTISLTPLRASTKFALASEGQTESGRSPRINPGDSLRGTDLRQLYSQRVRQQSPSHSLGIESVVTFLYP